MITDLIPNSALVKMQNDLIASAVIALRKQDKVVTGKTARSIRGETKRSKQGIDIYIYGSGGLKYIIEGKPANTKLPVKKVGNTFELLGSLKDWKNIRGFRGSDFVLARAIARNKIEPIDIAGQALEIYNSNYASKNISPLLSFSASQLGKQISKNINE